MDRNLKRALEDLRVDPADIQEAERQYHTELRSASCFGAGSFLLVATVLSPWLSDMGPVETLMMLTLLVFGVGIAAGSLFYYGDRAMRRLVKKLLG